METKICKDKTANRVCSVCNEDKPRTEYYNYRLWRCKLCEIKRTKEYQSKNKEKVKAVKALYVKNNRETILEKQRARYHANSEELIAKNRLYKENNKEKVAATYKKYRENNKEKYLQWQRDWRARNPDGLEAIEKRNTYGRSLRTNLTDTYFRARINRKAKGLLPKSVLDANPEEFELLKQLIILQINLKEGNKNENTDNNIVSSY
jgi:hypothetical protein